MLAQKLLSGGAEDKIYSDDVFQTVTRTGTGSSATITTGFQPDFVWVKARSAANSNYLFDSSRGTNALFSNLTNGQQSEPQGITSLNPSGYTLGTNGGTNGSGTTFVDWVFKKKSKFFDVVTYTGNGVAGRQIPHALGIAPGMIIVKSISIADGWAVYHRSLGATKYLWLHNTNPENTLSVFWDNTEPSATDFTIGTNSAVNQNAATYVAYLFAHDTSTDGIIQCGSYVGTGVADLAVTLGNEPQYVMIKCSSATQADGWIIADTMRGMDNSANAWLKAQSSGAETAESARIIPTATGFKLSSNAAVNTNAATYIYLAIRRPNKPPTSGTQVYNAIATSAASGVLSGAGFPPDMIHYTSRSSAIEHGFCDRLRGKSNFIYSNAVSAEFTDSRLADLTMDGVAEGGYYSGFSRIAHFFRRAPGVFDQVCYTGTGVAKTEAHNLGVVPELIITKARSIVGNWTVQPLSDGTQRLRLNSDAAQTGDAGPWNNTAPTSTLFTLGADTGTNTSSATYIAYLFATKAGISKVGSYTGNGGTQTINCGFTTGARFILIKRTDLTGDWFVWDTVRGIVAGNDPHLSLNTTAAEVTTDDSIDPNVVGFDINQLAATNINVTSATYIYLALA